MIIKDNIDNQPILSNVGQVGEFRIRNSAKAFSILSSGLYANKIRAIIREYSCNAVDSHVEAGRNDIPFDVHLPNSLEPWFSVRDYGVGLDEQQVRNIFTTYFESTKNNTDEMIGGLGLGSKSAFSYTDNFTIVAVKNGMKRVYTAFINEQGVPSIAQMGEEGSDEPSGVEIRFAVEDTYDFRKFYEEARVVYKHFKLRPVISGGFSDFTFIDPEYTERDIIPGIHTFSIQGRAGYRRSVAIMGNIEYPLDIPGNADLGGLEHLLNCDLAIEFGIGELDIQASREGLSYIPETITAIKVKLEALNAILADKVAAEASKIKNNWEKVFFYQDKMRSSLWPAATSKHVKNINFKLMDLSRYNEGESFRFTETVLAEKFNIKLAGFHLRDEGLRRVAIDLQQHNTYDKVNDVYIPNWNIQIDKKTQFVVNDTTTGATTRSKYHWRTDESMAIYDKVYVIDKADKKKDINLKAFLKAIANPPANRIRKASTLMKKERAAGIGKNVSILQLEKRDDADYNLRSNDMVWRAAGVLDAFDDANTYYYLRLSGLTAQIASDNPEANMYTIQDFSRAIKGSGILTDTMYGVRKADLKAIQEKPNWINLEDHIRDTLAQNNSIDIRGIVKEAIKFDSFFKFPQVQKLITDANSPYLKLFNQFADVKTANTEVRQGFECLCTIYGVPAGKINVTAEIDKYTTEMDELAKRYPLLKEVSRHYYNYNAFAEYINAIDLMKK